MAWRRPISTMLSRELTRLGGAPPVPTLIEIKAGSPLAQALKA